VTVLEDVRKVQAEVAALTERADIQATITARTEEQINGERGLSAAINALTTEVHGLRRAAYWVAGLIIAGSLSFAFSVLTVFN
jgi:hypothetical protein